MLYSSINGIEDQYISISDRALAYGDGLFTTAKIVNGEIQRLNEHIERLQSGCQQLGICQPARPVRDRGDRMRHPAVQSRPVTTGGVKSGCFCRTRGERVFA